MNWLSLHDAFCTFAAASWRQWRLRDRAAVSRYHKQQLRELAVHASANFPFFADAQELSFDSWPRLDKQILIDNFDQLNSAKLRAGDVRAALSRGEQRLAGYCIGQSTGTSGNRGYYVISERERFIWLGTILAKTMPDVLWRRQRVALAMPNMSSLYQSAEQSGQITLRFFDLAKGVESWAEDILQFRPNVIVAPPKVLRWLAEQDCLPDARLFSGAEVLDLLDRAMIERKSRFPLREIYMATEGLFGVSCRYGTLHLAEDVVHFEWERAGADSNLVVPIVTDFTRRAQAMIRYRMNDLVELDDQPCRCGSAFQAVKRIVGRCDDCLEISDTKGRLRMVTPDVLRNAVVDAHPSIDDFRVVQTAPDAIRVSLPKSVPAEAIAATQAMLAARLAQMCVAPKITVVRGITTPFDHKLRRVLRF